MTLSVDEIYGKYIDMGFSNFKIEGRTLHIIDVIDSYIYYMILPEYQNVIRSLVLKK